MMAANSTYMAIQDFSGVTDIFCLHKGIPGVMYRYGLTGCRLTDWSRCALVITEIIQNGGQLDIYEVFCRFMLLCSLMRPNQAWVNGLIRPHDK